MFVANIVPGQGFQAFTVYEQTTSTSKSGRAVTGSYNKTRKKLFGMLTNASQREVEQWKQNGHPVTHKIVQYSAHPRANATDYLKLDNGRYVYVSGVKNHADMNICITYYVEERADLAIVKDGEQHEQFGNGCPGGRR